MLDYGKSFAGILVLWERFFVFCGKSTKCEEKAKTFSAFLENDKEWEIVEFLADIV